MRLIAHGRAPCKGSKRLHQGNGLNCVEGHSDGRIPSRHRPPPVLDPIEDATQYSRAPMMNRNAPEYWVTRFRG
jgi:hypothetical protein